MGRSLLAREPVFEQALSDCDAAIQAIAGWSVIDQLRDPTRSIERIDVVQPLLFALAIGYAALWRSWGIEPDAVVGHSMGEIAAAQISGRLSLADAATVIVRRSALMQGLPKGGSMLAVDLGAAELLAKYPHVALAAENGPSASVVAGERAQLEVLAAELESLGVRCRPIAVDVASHSPAVDVLDEPLARVLAQLDPQPGTIAMYSTVEGRRLAPGERLDGHYWRRNLRQSVRLWPAIGSAIADAHELFIELGPHPVLLPAVREGLDALGARGFTIASGRRDADEQLEACRSLASLYEAGLELDWDAIYAGARLDAALPGYPFQRSAYWLPRPRVAVPAGTHPFLGERIELAHEHGATQVWTGCVALDRAAFLRDHLVEGSCVLPGMGSVDLVLAALDRGCELHELTFERAIVLHDDEPIELQLRIEAGRFEIWGKQAGAWSRRVLGRIAARREPGPRVELAALRERCRPTHDRASFYARLNQTGNLWGPAFAGVEAIARDGDELLVDLVLPPSIAGELGRHRFHPALLDACAQALLSVAGDDRGSLVLAEIGRIAIYGAAERVHASWIRVDAQQQRGSLRGDVVVVDETGARVLEIEGLRVQFLHERQAGGWFHVPTWRAVGRVQPSTTLTRRFAFVGGAPELRRATAEWLAGRGVVGDGEPTDLVHIVDNFASDASSAAQLDATVRACMAALASGHAGARMWLVTRGGAPLDGACDPVQSAVWGLGRVMQVELGRRFARAIDLDPDSTLTLDQLAQALGEELLGEDTELELLHRGGQRLALRLEARAPIPIPNRTSPLARLDPGTSVLITGGLGGLGLRMADHLLGRGARRLILLGRTSLPERSRWGEPLDATQQRQIEAVRALERRGAEVHVVALDVGDEAAVRAWADRWTIEQRPPIRVIVHAAGVQHPRALEQLGEQDLRADLRAKLAGAVALERVFAEQLDCLLLFSSAASLLPSPLLGGYTAANAFLDGFAIRSRAAGRPVWAISWGLFGEGGMAQRHTAERGSLDAFADMDPQAAFATLDRILTSDLAHVGVLAIDWPAWLSAHPQLAASPYFESLRDEAEPADASAAELDPMCLPADPESRRAWLDAYLRRQLTRVLRLPDAAQIDEHAPLTSLGLDSLMALELRNRVEAETGAAPAVVELLRGISLTRLTELVDAQLGAAPRESDWEELTL
jgi:acyl transferase domain-containing protein